MLVELLVMVIVVGLLYWLITLLPIPQPFKNVALVIVIVICIFWLLGYAGFLGGPYWHHPLR